MIIIFIIELLRVILFNLILSLDNISIIALSTKDFSEEIGKRVSLVSMCIGIVLKTIIASLLINVFMISWLPIRLIGGVILIIITWNLLKAQKSTSSIIEAESRPIINYWKAIFYTLLADMSMSLENMLAITVTANGKLYLIIFALLISMPILLFGCHLIERLMKKYNIIIYLGIAALAYTSVSMVLEDQFIVDYIPHIVSVLIPLATAMLVIIYGIRFIKVNPSKVTNSNIQ